MLSDAELWLRAVAATASKCFKQKIFLKSRVRKITLLFSTPVASLEDGSALMEEESTPCSAATKNRLSEILK